MKSKVVYAQILGRTMRCEVIPATTEVCRVCGEPVSLADSAIQFELCRPAHRSCLLGEQPKSKGAA